MSGLVSWFWSVWQSLLDKLGFGSREASLTLLGLENAGKTSLLHRLSSGEFVIFTPTERAHAEQFDLGGISFRAWDLGGHESVRHLWSQYSAGTDAILFMVDSADAGRLEEAKDELDVVLSVTPRDIPVAILFNKTDLPTSLSSEELERQMGVAKARGGAGGAERPVAAFRCSVSLGDGYEDALRWVAEHI